MAFLRCHLLFGYFCGCKGFCHRTDSALFPFPRLFTSIQLNYINSLHWSQQQRGKNHINHWEFTKMTKMTNLGNVSLEICQNEFCMARGILVYSLVIPFLSDTFRVMTFGLEWNLTQIILSITFTRMERAPPTRNGTIFMVNLLFMVQRIVWKLIPIVSWPHQNVLTNITSSAKIVCMFKWSFHPIYSNIPHTVL